MYLRVFLTFHTGLFVFSRVVRDVLVFLCLVFKFFIPKSCCHVLSMRYAHVASMLFGRRVRHHSVVKSGLPLCHWKRHCILFLLVWRVTADDEQFVIDSRFFSSSLFSLYQRKCMFVLFIIIFYLILYVFYCLFLSLVFFEKNLCFQFIP